MIMILKIIRYFTKHVQLKGMAKMLWLARGPFRRTDRLYPIERDLRMRLDEQQLYQWWYTINYGGYELVLLLQRLLSVGDIVMDVGANIGYISMNAAKLVGDSGRVFSFEPSDSSYRHLCENIDLNGISNIVPRQVAISDRTGTATFNVATDAGLSRLDNLASNDFGLVLAHRTKVEVDTLDNIWSTEAAGSKVKLIKLDIEGHEMSALRGGSSLLKKTCDYVIMEINAGALLQNGVMLGDVVAFMKGLGYEPHWIRSHTADLLRFTRMPTLGNVTGDDVMVNPSGEVLFVKERNLASFRDRCGDLITE
jgi:FkbM family methyltransferase